MTITNISAGAYWDNDVKVVAESSKAIQLEVVGDKRFVDCVGTKAWFPKAALEIEDGAAKVKPWFIGKMTIWQERVTGRAGR